MGRTIIRRVAKPPHTRGSPYAGTMNDTLIKDGLERILVTMVLSGISVAAVVIQDWDYVWVPIISAALNIIKVLIAQYVGDPDTGGFVNVVQDELGNDSPADVVAPAGDDLPEDEFIDLRE